MAYGDTTYINPKSQSRARFDASVLTSLRLRGAATLDDLFRRFEEDASLKSLHESLKRLLRDDLIHAVDRPFGVLYVFGEDRGLDAKERFQQELIQGNGGKLAGRRARPATVERVEAALSWFKNGAQINAICERTGLDRAAARVCLQEMLRQGRVQAERAAGRTIIWKTV